MSPTSLQARLARLELIAAITDERGLVRKRWLARRAGISDVAAGHCLQRFAKRVLVLRLGHNHYEISRRGRAEIVQLRDALRRRQIRERARARRLSEAA